MFPLLLSALLFLIPLRLIAKEEREKETSTTGRQEQTRNNTQSTQIAASKVQYQHSDQDTPSYGSLEANTDLTASLTPAGSSAFYDTSSGSYLFDRSEVSSAINVDNFYDPKPLPDIELNVFIQLARSSSMGSRFTFDPTTQSLAEVRTLLCDPTPSYEEVWQKFFDAINYYCAQKKLDSSAVQRAFEQQKAACSNRLYSLPFTREKILFFLEEIGMTSSRASRPRPVMTSLFSRVTNDALQQSDRSSEIHYKNEMYHIKKTANRGILPAICPALYRDKREKALNRTTIDRMAKEIGERVLCEQHTSEENLDLPMLQNQFERSFKVRRFLGQPMTVGAYLDWQKRPNPYSNPIFYCCERVAIYTWAVLKYLFCCCVPQSDSSRRLEEQENDGSVELLKKGTLEAQK